MLSVVGMVWILFVFGMMLLFWPGYVSDNELVTRPIKQ